MALTHNAYTIGWICALADELAAATVMLDEHHEPLSSQPETDTNAYELGRIGKHNVVLACLPSGWTGKESAAIVATHLQSTFPALRYGLMVGIGGGVPSDDNDIRLGDITVGRPGLKNGGVVQYDFGKTVEGGKFIQTGALSPPPQKLLTAMNKVQARHRVAKYEYMQHLQDLPNDLKDRFTRPTVDHQFVATYDPADHASTCDRCDKKQVKQLAPREPPVPRVFYGTIASADQVMRHGKTRDRVAEQSGAICFEMEAAGLVNSFPCVVVRGICDYADTHKNKKWQPYAALAAAAYAKELLRAVAPVDVVKETPMASIVSQATHRAASVLDPATSDLASQQRTEQSTLGFFSMLNQRVLGLNTIALGRFVLDIRAPWNAYCPADKPGDDRIGISLQFRFQDILQTSQTETQLLAERLATILQKKSPLEALSTAAEKTYILLNAEDWLKSACGSSRTRSWLENSIKTGRPVFLIVGIHVVSNFPASADEWVVAILYRQVSFGWLWRRDIDSATLVRDQNIWMPLFITRAADQAAAEDDEFVEAYLENTTNTEPTSNQQVLQVDGWRFVL